MNETPDPELAELCRWRERAEKSEAYTATRQKQVELLFDARNIERAAREKAEAAYASLLSCFDTVLAVLLERENANMLNLRNPQADRCLRDRLSVQSTKETVPGMQTEQAAIIQTKHGSQNAQSETVAGSESCSSCSFSEILSQLSQNASRETHSGLPEQRPLQGPMSIHPEKCSRIRAGEKTGSVPEVWLENIEASRASPRLQQALRRGVALQALSREEALQIASMISSDCGQGWLSPEVGKALMEALTMFLREHENSMQRTDMGPVEFICTPEMVEKAKQSLALVSERKP